MFIQKLLLSLLVGLITNVSQSDGFEFWNDLRVKFDTMPTGNAFERLPRNTVDAESEGWTQESSHCTNDGRFNGFRWFHPFDNGVALLYDTRGDVAGIQTLVPQKDILTPKNTYRFDKVQMYQNHTISGIEYFVITVYFGTPGDICRKSEELVGKRNIGQDGQVYFQIGPSSEFLRPAPKSRYEASKSGWTVNKCIPGMGWHNFYEMEKYQETNCSEAQPTCILYNEHGQMHGFCLTYPGMTTVSNRWEHPPSDAVEVAFGDTPKCVVEQNVLNGATSVHFYFINKPWEINCN